MEAAQVGAPAVQRLQLLGLVRQQVLTELGEIQMPRPRAFPPLHERAVDPGTQERGPDGLHVLHLPGVHDGLPPPAQGRHGILYGLHRAVPHGIQQRVRRVIIAADRRGVRIGVMARHVPDKILGGLQLQGVPGIMCQHPFQFRTVAARQLQGLFQQRVLRLPVAGAQAAPAQGGDEDESFQMISFHATVFFKV